MTEITYSDSRTVTSSVQNIPFKAIPSRKGSLFSFREDDLEENHLNVLLVSIAQELRGTDIATQEGGYPERPSVLLIVEKDKDIIDVASRSQTEPIIYNAGYGEKVAYDSDNYAEGLRHPQTLLQSVSVVDPLGFFSLQVPADVSTDALDDILDHSREFFDIVLMAHRVKRLKRETPYNKQGKTYTVHYVGQEPILSKKAVAEKRQNVIIASDSTAALSMVTEGLRWFVGPEGFEGKTLTKMLTRDIIRHMLQVPLKALEPFDATVKQPRKVFNINKATLFSAVSGGSAGAGLMWMGSYSSGATLPEPLNLILPTLMSFLGLLAGSGTGALAVFGTVTGVDNFRTKKAVNEIQSKVFVPKIEPTMPKRSITARADSHGPMPPTTPSNAFSMPASMIAKRHQDVKNAWFDYEVHPIKLLEMPLMTDMNEVHTRAFFAAMREAENWAEVANEDRGYQDKYAEAVKALEEAFAVAEAHAKKMSLTNFDNTARRKIKKARPFVQVAQNETSATTERLNAWRKATSLLEGVMNLPDKTVIGLLESR